MALNLMDNRVTVGQILSHPRARALAFEEVPALRKPKIQRMVWNMPLWRVLQLAQDWMPAYRIRALLQKLREA